MTEAVAIRQPRTLGCDELPDIVQVVQTIKQMIEQET